MNVMKMQHEVVRQLAANGGRDMQIVDGVLYEVAVRKISPDDAREAVKNVIEATTSPGAAVGSDDDVLPSAWTVEEWSP